MYFRTNANYAWYVGGTHSSTALDPGGGQVGMVFDSNANFGVLTASPQTRIEAVGIISATSTSNSLSNATGDSDTRIIINNVTSQSTDAKSLGKIVWTG